MGAVKNLTFAAVMVLILAIPGGSLRADDFQIIPSIALRQEYSNNIFFDEIDEVDDFITTVIAGLEISNRTERMDLNLRGTVAPFFYWDNSDLDEVNQDYYSGSEVVLDPMVRELLLLEAPMKPLCSESCEGIAVPEHLRPHEEVFGGSAPDARLAPLLKLKEALTKNEE